MTEFETKVLLELAELRRIVESLRSDFSLSQITYFENLAPSAIVGTDYAAYKFGCSQAAVTRGRFDTDKIPRLRNKPIRFVKSEVDKTYLMLNQPIKQTVAKLRHDMEKKRK